MSALWLNRSGVSIVLRDGHVYRVPDGAVDVEVAEGSAAAQRPTPMAKMSDGSLRECEVMVPAAQVISDLVQLDVEGVEDSSWATIRSVEALRDRVAALEEMARSADQLVKLKPPASGMAAGAVVRGALQAVVEFIEKSRYETVGTHRVWLPRIPDLYLRAWRDDLSADSSEQKS